MRSFIVVVLMVLALPAISQVVISGYVVDSSSRERIPGANIYCSETKNGASTNSYGFFSLVMMKTEQCNLMVSFLGYKSQLIRLKPLQDTLLQVQMVMGSTSLREVEISASQLLYKQPEMSKIALPMEKLAVIPRLAGETDIMRVFQLMPGVQTGKEGTSGLYVRGGTPDQNMILLDDIPMYYVNHVAGFLSVFNADAINAVTLYKGGFPARYGGRLSSVVDIRMKEGNMKQRKGSLCIGLLSSKFTYEIPLLKERTSAIISFRRSLFDLLTRSYFFLRKSSDESNSAGYTIYDLNVKVNHKISDRDHLYISYYSGHDRLFTEQRTTDQYNTVKEYKYAGGRYTKWGNTLLGFRWNHLVNQKLFINNTLGYTVFYYDMGATAEKRMYETNTPVASIHSGFKSRINDLILKSDLDYTMNQNHRLRMGIHLTIHKFIPSVTYYDFNGRDTTGVSIYSEDDQLLAPEGSIYFEDQFDLSARWNFTAGFRLSSFYSREHYFLSPEPRVTSNFLINDEFSFKLSYSRISQPLHLLSNSGAGIPADLWVPATPLAKPELSHQVASGLYYNLRWKGVAFSMEAYLKEMKNLIDFKEGISLFSGKTAWEKNIVTGGYGKVVGVEFFIEKKAGAFTGWLSYTLSKNTRRFSGINQGQVFPYTYDRPHELSVTATYEFSKKISVSATWVYSSGNSITLPTEKTLVKELAYGTTDDFNLFNNGWVYSWSHIYPSKNNYRMPAYHRLDISASFSKQKSHGKRIWSFDIYNAYNHLNTYYLFFKPTADGNIRMYSFALFPIIPSISYSYSF